MRTRVISFCKLLDILETPMKPEWNDLVSAMQDAVAAWRPLVPSLPPTFTTNNGVTIQVGDLTQSLDLVLTQLELVTSNHGVDPVALVHVEANLRSTVPAILGTIAQIQNGFNPVHINQLVSQLWNLKTQLPYMSPLSAAPGLESTVAEIDLRATAASLQELLSTCRTASNDVIGMVSKVQTSLELSKELEATIENHSRLAGAAKISTEGAASTAAAARDEIVASLNELNAGLTKLSQQQGNVDSLLSKASTSVALAAKDGLASSFAKQAEALGKRSFYFAASAALGVACLANLSIGFLLGWGDMPAVFKDGVVEPAALLARLMALGPMLWFTWFCVRQYSTLSRLQADYAFKTSSALAYIGYRNEMSDNPDMVKLLQELAIRNFGAPPTRLFDRSNASSPADELVKQAMAKGGLLDRLAENIKGGGSGKS